VKEVVKAIRKGFTGICIMAGDVSPIDVLSHIPIICEEKDIPYCYVRSRMEMGDAAQTKKPTSVVLIQCSQEEGRAKARFLKLQEKIKNLNLAKK